MQLDTLLTDVTESAPGTSRRARMIRLTSMLNERHGAERPITLKGVEKWFDRKAIPGPWLMKIADLRTPPINLSRYS